MSHQGATMLSSHQAAESRSARGNTSRWLISAAVAAAIAGTAFSSTAISAEEDALEEVTITGSRIVRRDLAAPSPIVTVSEETFKNTSTTSMEATLQKLPQFTPAGNQFVSGAQAGPTVTPGAATLNLRGLGTNRNLVLIDGRRPQPANASLVVDINTIPQAAVQGVEVITGGASAVYGPDAIAGVTNFLLKRNFQGLDIDVQSGMTQEGDGNEHRVSMLMGMNGAEGRGNVMVALDYTQRSAVLQLDRKFYVNGWLDPDNAGGDFVQHPSFFPGGNTPSPAAVAQVLGTTPGQIGTGSEIRFNTDGTAFITAGGVGYTGGFGTLNSGASRGKIIDRNNMVIRTAAGNLDQRYTTQFASTPSERHSIFMRGLYDVTDNISAFVQANYSNSTVITRGNYAPAITVWGVTVPRDDVQLVNPADSRYDNAAPIVATGTRTLPAELVTLLNSRTSSINATTGLPQGGKLDPWSMYQVLNYFGALEATNTTNLFQMTAGVNGKMGIKDWTWESYFARGTTKTDAEIPQPSLQRYQQLINAPNFGRNAVIVGPASPGGRGYTLNCTSGLPVFQEFTPSADCIKSMEIRGKQLTVLNQDVFEANMQGAAFALPAGEARFAAGVAYRKNEFVFDPINPVEQILDNPVGFFASNKTSGETNVKELYGELLVPVIAGLELELGYRLSDFNTAGTEGTYKALFTWKAMDQLTFRGGYQVATRAPNTAELFAGNRLEVVGFPGVEPCSAATNNAWGNLAANPNRLQVQALCRAIINKARGLPATDTSSPFDQQNFNAAVSVNGRLMGSGPNGWTRQSPPFFPLEIELEKGNPNVAPETAKTFTLGAVVTDPFGLEGFTLTVDAYQIKITDAIQRLGSFTAYFNCFNAAGGNPTYDVNNEFCRLITRNGPTADREQVDSLYLNLGALETRGIDLAVGWQKDMGPGTFLVNTAVNYLDTFTYQPDPGAPARDATGTFDQSGQFDYRLLTNLGYRWGAFNVGLEWRHLPSIDAVDKALVPTTTTIGAASYNMFNLSGGWDLGKVKIRAGIDNLFDKSPLVVGAIPNTNPATMAAQPFIDTNSNVTNPSYYDVMGRRFYLGAKVSF
jgi:iron complex outermembrane recepter protein